jgi:uncharacterized membrane-anchored protein
MSHFFHLAALLSFACGALPRALATKPDKEGTVVSDRSNYSAGRQYAEFRAGDQVAKCGWADLVMGGAGAIALKTGPLAQVAILVLKAWKLVAIGLGALSSLSVRMGKKLTGRDTR